MLSDSLCEFTAGHLGHDQVGQEQTDPIALSLDDLDRLLRASCDDRRVPVVLEHLGDERAQDRFVFGDQNRFGAALGALRRLASQFVRHGPVRRLR